MSSRSLHKTIRISQEIYDYIEKFSGSSWNDRFNAMVEDVLNSESVREAKKKELDKQIEDRRQRLNDLDAVISEAKQKLGVGRYW